MPALTNLFHVLTSLAFILVVAQCGAWTFRKLGQPSVVGEILGGLFVGPTFLGRFAPNFSQVVLPTSAIPTIESLSQMGILLYMFFIGIEFNFSSLQKQARSAILLSTSSLLLPLAAGFGLGLQLFPSMHGPHISLFGFALFTGIALAITAFPVLARILQERGESNSDLGRLALTCAAIADLFGWCMLAIVSAIAQQENTSIAYLWPALALLLFFYLGPLRAVCERLLRIGGGEKIGDFGLSILFAGLLASAALTEAIGIHAIFGAFLFGTIIPHESRIDATFLAKAEHFVRLLLLPTFFALTGLRTNLWLINSSSEFATFLVVLLLATFGKLAGSTLPAVAMGFDWKTSTRLGILLNTRGLVELIVLSVGLELGILSNQLYAILVLMAVITTAMTGPLLRLVDSRS